MTLKTYQRRAPFLQRNWINGVNAFQDSVMGSALSTTPKHHGPFAADDEDAPPTKRRRLSTDMEEFIATPSASEDRPALRIEVLKIFHKESKKVRQQHGVVPRDILPTKANCRIYIMDKSTGRSKILFCQSQVCDMTTYKNPFGPHRVARIDLASPFFVPGESILINQRADNFDFAETYQLRVELEAFPGASWPPLDSRDFGILPGDTNPVAQTPKGEWVLTSDFEPAFGRHRSHLRLAQSTFPGAHKKWTDYVMDVDLRWTTGFRALKRLDKGSKSCITAIDPDDERYSNGRFEPTLEAGLNGVNGVNGINGHIHEDSSNEHDQEDEMEGDQTPSRSLRTREKNKVYNLKVLSDQAQGRERKRRGRAAQANASEGQVAYYLPTDQPVLLDFWCCVVCSAQHQSIEQLQCHLQITHTDLDCAFENTSQGPQFRITHCPESTPSPSKPYQLGRPMKPFHLPSLVAGDHSWITSRLGPDNTEDPLRSPSKASQVRQLPDRSFSQGPSSTPKRPRKQKKVLVPDTKQPLFHSVSKAQLKPGEELPNPTADISWLLQKHRESIGDFTDVTPSEKEYIRQWDSFILQQGLTGSAYFPRAWLKFVRENTAWLVDASHRMTEFGKHISALLALNVLNDEVVEDAFALINGARETAGVPKESPVNGEDGTEKKNEASKTSPRASHIRKSANGCKLCELPVMGPRLLLCSNKKCNRRLYHSDCASELDITPARRTKWLCKSCRASSESS